MGRFLVLATLALLAVAEVAAVMWLVDSVGTAGTLLVLGFDMAIGLVLMRLALRRPPGPTGDRGWWLAAGAVIALPGLVLDVVGLALLVPPVRSWLGQRITRGTESALRRSGISVVTVTDPDGARRTTVVPGDVVPGEVVQDDAAAPEPASGGSGAAGGSSRPPVIRGELIAGPDQDSAGRT